MPADDLLDQFLTEPSGQWARAQYEAVIDRVFLVRYASLRAVTGPTTRSATTFVLTIVVITINMEL